TGGSLAWSMAALQPAVTAGVAAFSAPHPARLHTSARRLLTPAAARQLAFYQVPTLPERALVRGDLVAEVLATGAATPFAPDVVDTYRTVMRIPFAAHTAMESLRWAVRSTPRPDGRRYLAALRRPVDVPALQVHAGRDGLLRRDLADADGAALARDFRFEVIDDAGHFLPEEAPDAVTDLLLDWLPRVAQGLGSGSARLDELRRLDRVDLADTERRAPARDAARTARRLAREAHAAPVEDQPVREHPPLRLLDQTPDHLLDLDRVLPRGPAETAPGAAEVRVHGQPRHAERVPEHDVRRLAAHPGQRHEVLEPRRHLAVEPLDERLADPDHG